MKTNFTKENFLVLTNIENKIVAIIQCKSGEQNITDKLVKAISEDYDANTVIFCNENEKVDDFLEISDYKTILDDNDYEHNFKVIITTDGDELETEFTLTFSHVY